ncbi:hypothetical protein ACN4EK_06255 [Pantanalinema rosaneae CENA516]|uniref:hypothetical protein n=1 Tax=Pantanalinema rosaneae TaxID=1620701 RepID=UPI003D6DCB36
MKSSLVLWTIAVSLGVSSYGVAVPAPSVPPVPPPESTLLPPRSTPVTTIRVTNKQVAIRLINRTSEPINYIAIGDTPERSLGMNQSVLLQGLNLPTTLNCYYQSKQTFEQKSLRAELKANNATGILEVTLKEGAAEDSHTLVITVSQQGNVYLY